MFNVNLLLKPKLLGVQTLVQLQYGLTILMLKPIINLLELLAHWGFSILSSSTSGSTDGTTWTSADGLVWTSTGNWKDSGQPTSLSLNINEKFVRLGCYGGSDSQSYTAVADVVEAKPAVTVTAISESTPSITTSAGGGWSGTDGSGQSGWNQSKVWSDDISGEAQLGYGKVQAFDGKTTGSPGYLPVHPSTGVWTPGGGIAFNSSVRIFTTAENGQQSTGYSASIDGTPSAVVISNGSKWTTIATGSGVLNSITNVWDSNSVNDYIALQAVEIDGDILVNTGTPGAPVVDAQVTGPTFPPATGTISEINSANNQLTFSETTGRWLVTESGYDATKKLNTTVLVPVVLNQGNAAHVALFNAINTSLTAYATDKATFVDALRTKIQGLGLSIPELQVLCNVSHTLIKAYVVTVASHNSANKFYLDGSLQLALTLKKGTTYIFDQDDATNTGHPLKLYTDAAKTTEYTTGVSFIGTPGSALARTIFNVPANAPATLYYQCGNHAAMGAAITIVS